MSPPILTAKLYIPPPRPQVVPRLRLIEKLNIGLGQNQNYGHKLTLVSAPAGFGKTTLVSEWVNQKDEERKIKDESEKIPHPSSFIPHPFKVAWLSLDEGDNDPARFLTYLVAALQTIAPAVGQGVLAMLQSPQPPAPESILTTLLNEINTIPDKFILVLDDYHLIDSQPIDMALTFLIEHSPPQMHLVIITREDPTLPLSRLRVRGQLTELRAANLRFTPDEATQFLNNVMNLTLTTAEIIALETRTEGWIAGLQLAALAMQGQQDTTSFIQSFTGSHRFVLDYLAEEVFQQQPENIQTFLLQTSVLERLCGPLCDAVLGNSDASGQETLAHLERANLFIVPLDNERRWYRYHHLFADLLRQRLQHSLATTTGDETTTVASYHIRASIWYEENGLDLDAFHHATIAKDYDRAERLIEGKGMPLHFRGAVSPVLNWLASLETAVLDERPLLWVMYASALTMTGQITGVEEKLQAAESALQNAEQNDKTRNLIGHIAAIRALLATTQYKPDVIIAQSRRALEYLHPDNLSVRTATIWKLGVAYQFQGDRVAAKQAFNEAIAISEKSGNTIIHIAAIGGLGHIQELDNQLHLAAASYQRALQLLNGKPNPMAYEVSLGMARLSYEWNDLDAAQQYGQQSIQIAQQIELNDRSILCQLFLARLKLAQGDVAGAANLIAEADQSTRQHNFQLRIPDVAAAQIRLLLRQGDLETAVNLAPKHNLPLSQARVQLAQENPSAALATLAPWQQHVTTKNWADEQLKVILLQAVAYQAIGEKTRALSLLEQALTLTEANGFIRLYVDEGPPMLKLLMTLKENGRSNVNTMIGMETYIHKILTAFGEKGAPPLPPINSQPLLDPLSEREIEVIQYIAEGLSNREIAERLYLSLNTVKVHTRNIYSKLDVHNRTQAVAKARMMGVLHTV